MKKSWDVRHSGKVGRDSRGHVRHPELLYRAWKVRESHHELAIIFRDHSMSDQIGFHYQRSPGPVAAGDFMAQARLRSATPAAITRRRSYRSSWTARIAGNTIPTAACRFCARFTRESPGALIFGRSRWADSSKSTRRQTRSPACSPEAGSATISRSGSATPKTIRPGTRFMPQDRSWRPKNASLRHEAATLERAWNEIYIAAGLRLVLVVRRRSFERARRPLRPSFSQAPAQRLHAPGSRPAGLAVRRDLARRSAPAACTLSPAAFPTSRSTAAPPILNGSTPPITPAATSAAP